MPRLFGWLTLFRLIPRISNGIHCALLELDEIILRACDFRPSIQRYIQFLRALIQVILPMLIMFDLERLGSLIYQFLTAILITLVQISLSLIYFISYFGNIDRLLVLWNTHSIRKRITLVEQSTITTRALSYLDNILSACLFYTSRLINASSSSLNVQSASSDYISPIKRILSQHGSAPGLIIKQVQWVMLSKHHIQSAPGDIDSGLIDVHTRTCLEVLCNIKEIYKRLAMTPLDYSNSDHRQLLFKIWNGLVKSCTLADDSRIETVDWTKIGFQGKDPATDLRSTGILSLSQLTLFIEHDKSLAMNCYEHSISTHWFPFACVGISVTAFILEMLLDDDEEESSNLETRLITKIQEELDSVTVQPTTSTLVIKLQSYLDGELYSTIWNTFLDVWMTTQQEQASDACVSGVMMFPQVWKHVRTHIKRHLS